MSVLLHVLGIDDASGPWYAFWSGFGSDLTLFTGLVAVVWSFWRRHNCHVRGCLRLGRHPVEGTSYVVCRFHHPHGEPNHADVLAAHRNRG